MDSKDYKKGACWWANRYELLGIALLIVATTLTIIAWDSFGIVAMFVVGLVLIGHKHFCYLGCHSKCHSNEECHTTESGKAVKEKNPK
jgi:hypothetical protein